MIFEVSSVHEQMQLQRILFIKLRNDKELNLSENDDDTTILERNSPEKTKTTLDKETNYHSSCCITWRNFFIIIFLIFKQEFIFCKYLLLFTLLFLPTLIKYLKNN